MVWFGEVPLHLDEIQAVVDAADVGLIIGTSSTVCLLANLLAPRFMDDMEGLPSSWLYRRYTGALGADCSLQSARKLGRSMRGLSVHGSL